MLALLCGAFPLVSSGAYVSSGKEPIYIGSQACGRCHDGPKMGHQFSKWRLTAHARAYAALSLPEAREITKLSGITEEPHSAKMCLGCHATASEEEDWRHGDEFHLEDGLQCEACHGPGSEYAREEIMRDKEKAMANGLIIPDKTESCYRCHRVKGSHVAVLNKKPFETNSAWAEILHPLPPNQNGKGRTNVVLPLPPAGTNTAPFKFTGVMACAECHKFPKMGFQYSKWRLGPHARAYAVLTTSRGYELASEANIQGNPQLSPACLQCHTTGADFTADSFAKGFDHRDGVQCESCHGPGSDYSPEAVMLDKATARAKGLLAVSAKTCAPCHEKAHGKPFDYEQAVKKIAHPVKAPETAGAPEPAYKNPLNLALTPDGRELWVACEASASVVVVDTATRKKLLEIPVGGQPNDVAFTPDGRKAFVSNRLDDNVSVVDVAAHKVVATIEVGDEPHGVLVDRQGKFLYVLNTSIDNISVVDVATLKEVKRLSASPLPLVARRVAGRQVHRRHTCALAVCGRPHALHVGGHGHRPRAGGGGGPGDSAGGQPVAGRGLASERRLRAVHAAADEEPRAHDPHQPRLDHLQRPGHPLARRHGGPGAARPEQPLLP